MMLPTPTLRSQATALNRNKAARPAPQICHPGPWGRQMTPQHPVCTGPWYPCLLGHSIASTALVLCSQRPASWCCMRGTLVTIADSPVPSALHSTVKQRMTVSCRSCTASSGTAAAFQRHVCQSAYNSDTFQPAACQMLILVHLGCEVHV